VELKQELVSAVLKKVREVDGRKKLTCTEAFGLARQFGVEIIEVGQICNQNNVKICKCQLGCFA